MMMIPEKTKYMKFIFCFFLIGIFCTKAFALSIPHTPDNYINDYAHILSANTINTLNSNLKLYEQKTSNQIVVATFPGKIDVPIEDFSTNLENQWKIGQKNKDNGVILVIFPEDHQLRIEVGYGLEGAIPDALANTIIQQEITPAFKAGDYNKGITAGVRAIMQAAKGEYKPASETFTREDALTIFFFIIAVLLILFLNKIGGVNYPNSRGGRWGGGPGSSSGSGDSFGGGGGSSGGGGASGRW